MNYSGSIVKPNPVTLVRGAAETDPSVLHTHLPSSATIARYKSQIAKAKSKRQALSHVKESMPKEHIAPFIWETARFPFYRNLIAPTSFPRQFVDFRSTSNVLAIQTLERELLWTASILRLFTRELSRFIELEAQFAGFWIRGDFDHASSILQLVEHEFGVSIWLIENTIHIKQDRFGLDEQKRYTYSIFREQSHPLIKYLAYYFSIRSEETVSSAKYRSTIETALLDTEPSFLDYLRSYLLLNARSAITAPEALLAYDETSPIIDRYLSFIKACQIACALAVVDGDPAMVASVRTALRLSELSLPDFRLENIRYVSKTWSGEHDRVIGAQAMYAYDEYTQGRYANAVQAAAAVLDEHPTRVDLLEILVRASVRISEIPDFPEKRLASLFANVILRNEGYAESVETLEKLALVNASSTMSAQLSAFLERERAARPVETVSKAEIIAMLNCPAPNPWQYKSFRRIDPSLPMADDLFNGYEGSPSLGLQIALQSATSSGDQAIHILSSLGLPEDRGEFYKARALERCGRSSEASELYERWLSSSYAPLRLEAARRLAWAYLSLERYEQCIELIAKSYLRNPHLHAALPILEILTVIEARGIATFRRMIALPIIYDAYSKHISTDRDGPRSDSYEDFLLAWHVKRPAELRNIGEALYDGNDIDREMLIYYLRYLCIPRIMDPSTAFEGTKDLLLERIAVCQMLTELDTANVDTYADEIRGITQEVVVSEGVRHIEQSRIYVDTEAIRDALEKTLPESFRRFSALAAAKPYDTERRELLKRVVEIIGSRIQAELLIPGNELDELFDAMFFEFADHFVHNTVHGLAAYLSGRIRHGILPNHLRSPLEVVHLATQRDSMTNTYRPNEYWNIRYPHLTQTAGLQLAHRLAKFTEEVDTLINTVNQKWIQLRRESTPEGLFDFNIFNVRRRVLQLTVLSINSYDSFLEMMFRFFWGFTEKSLTKVRMNFDEELKPRVNEAFDSLQQDLSVIVKDQHVPELDAAVTQARTDMNITLERVKNWFRLSTATDKPDFDLDTLVNIAIQSTNNCFRYSPIDPKVEIRGDTRLRGDTLSNFVELFYLFLSNIISRSGVRDRAPITRVSAEVSKAGMILLCIENEVAFESVEARRDAELRIEVARALVTGETAPSVVGKEGGTGYAKVWKVITYDLGCPFGVELGFVGDDQFRVNLWINGEAIRSP